MYAGLELSYTLQKKLVPEEAAQPAFALPSSLAAASTADSATASANSGYSVYGAGGSGWGEDDGDDSGVVCLFRDLYATCMQVC